MSHNSLQRRLGIGLTLAMTALWLIAAVAGGLIVRHSLDKELDSALEATAERILPLAVVEIMNRDNPDIPQQIASLHARQEHLVYLVRDAAGNTLLRAHNVDTAIFAERPRRGFYSTATHRIYGAAAVSDTLFVEAAEPLAYRRRAALEASAALLLPLIILVPLSFAIIWLLIGNSLRSVLAYRRSVAARGPGDLSPIAGEQLPSEILPIAEAVNELMDRLRRTLEAERSFTANSAHELRTPLAEALAQVQRLRRQAPEGPLRDRAAGIEQSLRGLSRLSEKLMQLARAESGGLLAPAPQDVVPILQALVDDYRSAGEHVHLKLPSSGTVESIIDPDALAILVRNLIENALKHGAADQPVEIELGADGLLSVINAGPVVPAAQLAHLTERFTRAHSTADGAGLGLAIANAIATGVGTTLALTSPAPDRADGFSATFKLP
ncbi:MAG TPA: ATP-binding protein [Halomonas sp.]|nr:ATP-binding protein [Halomonas sp.]